MSTTHAGNGTTTLSRQEQQFANVSTKAVIDDYQKRWQLATQMVETLFEEAPQSIEKGGYPIVPQTVVGIVANIFGFTPRAGLVESELHTKVEALRPSLSEELSRVR